MTLRSDQACYLVTKDAFDDLSNLIDAMHEAITETLVRSRRQVWADGTPFQPALEAFFQLHGKIVHGENGGDDKDAF